MGWLVLPDELKTFVSPHGKAATITVFKGRVAGSATWAETHVTSSGGGGSGYIHPQYGGQVNVQAPTISSYVDEKREFFLADNGKEQSYKFTNANFPIREGHIVSIYCVAPVEAGTEWLAWAENHVTDQLYSFSLQLWKCDQLSNTMEVYKRKFIEFVCHPGMIFTASLFDIFFVGWKRCLIIAAIAGAVRIYTHFWMKKTLNDCAKALMQHLYAVQKIAQASPLEDELRLREEQRYAAPQLQPALAG